MLPEPQRLLIMVHLPTASALVSSPEFCCQPFLLPGTPNLVPEFPLLQPILASQSTKGPGLSHSTDTDPSCGTRGPLLKRATTPKPPGATGVRVGTTSESFLRVTR